LHQRPESRPANRCRKILEFRNVILSHSHAVSIPQKGDISVEAEQSTVTISVKTEMTEQQKNLAGTRSRPGFTRQVASLVLAWISLCSYGFASESYREIGQPGEPIDLPPYVVAGRYTIFDFGSEYCPPCRQWAVQFKLLAEKYPDHYAIRRIDINRPGVVGIDWNSPLAQQYALHSIPHLTVFGPDKRLIADGEAAVNWLAEDLRHLQQK
jgi:thiol-disulfide isomerase/thioredoxin